MGNRICSSGWRRRPVEERLTRPQRLLRQPSDVDYKKLRKLILSRQLAPCFDALDLEEPHLAAADLEECPICFFYFPSLNRSACCSKGICTECFLQMKPSDATDPAQCPFCKSSCFAIEYRGARTEEEKCLEHAEEQKVIEAKIRLQCESQTITEVTSFGRSRPLDEVPYPLSDLMQGVHDNVILEDTHLQTHSSRNRELDEFEEVIVMEAIWQSLQESRLDRMQES